MLYWNGNLSNGELPFAASEEFINVLEPIMLGNTLEQQELSKANAFLNQITEDTITYVGSQVPVERFNITFTEGGFTSDNYKFTENVSHFDFKKEGFKAGVFSYTLEQKLEAEISPSGLTPILEKAARNMERVMKFYVDTYLPSMRIVALITGSSASLSTPAANVGGDYTDNIGALNGEDMTDLLLPIIADRAARYHLRGKAGATLDASDIFTCQKMITEYNSTSMDVLAVANGRTLYDLKTVLGSNDSIDATIPLTVPVSIIAGVPFTQLELIPDGKILFIDANTGDLILNAVNKTETQRGLGILNEGASSMNTLSEFNGTEAFIWNHGYHVFQREKLIWLDIDTASAGSGIMHATGVSEMEAWAANLRAGITRKAYIS